jgi:murein L,D-transpeptidase YafK
MLSNVIRILIVLTSIVLLTGCQLWADNRGNVPIPAALLERMAAIGTSPAEPMMIRVYKESSELEVWKRNRSGQYALLKTYPICKWSGTLGPKIKEGDYQSPEGFYDVTPALLNPKSSYHLAFNVGFPNKLDQALARTGSYLMIHGDCKSVGCYAMTDDGIKEIYALAREAFRGGSTSFQLQLLPFRMTEDNFARHSSSPHVDFWRNLKAGADSFDQNKQPPLWDVCEQRYVFNLNDPRKAPLNPNGACPTGSFSTMAAI